MATTELSCTFTTSTKMTPIYDVMATRAEGEQLQQQRQQQQQQQQMVNMDSCSGYCQLAYCDERMWSTPSPSEKPSWSDIHDIVRTSEVPAMAAPPHDRKSNSVANAPAVRADDNAELLATGSRKRRRYEDVSASESSPPGAEARDPERPARPEEGNSGGENEAGGADLFASIAQAILQARDGEILLADIYHFMAANYAVFRQDVYRNWRVRVRHVLSVNSCFVKGKRAKSGRGFYWTIHPACVDAFRAGDVSKRRAAQLVKRWQKRQAELDRERARSAEDAGCACADGSYPEGRCPDGYVIPDRVAPHQRVYTPMTTVALSEYDYYELMMNLSDGRKQQ